MTRKLFTAFGLSAMIAVSAGFPAAAQPDPRPGIGDFLDPTRIGGLFANIGIAGLRAVTELEYQQLSTDVLRGQIALSGVTLRPALAYDRTRLCSVEIDRLAGALARARVVEHRPDDAVGAARVRLDALGVHAEVGLQRLDRFGVVLRLQVVEQFA